MATLKSIKNKYLTASDGTVLGVTTNTENISALSFKLATADSLTKFNLVDGFADDYNDTTGVDTGVSTYAVRDSTGNYYEGGEDVDGTKTTYTNTGQSTHTNAAGVTSIEIKMWGAGGGNNGQSGGGGGFSSGTWVGSPASFYVSVGSAGANGGNEGGSGGGMSGVWENSVMSATADARLVAGGGGSGGRVGGPGGAGGGATAENAAQRNSGYGEAGTQSAGGGSGGSQWTGGSGNGAGGTPYGGGGSGQSGSWGGGGGGGGWFGGGRGQGGTPSHGDGGGGGSGYINTSYITSGVTTTGSGQTPGNSGDSDRGSSGNKMTAGKVVIQEIISGPAQMTLVSNAYTAQADPTTARIILDEETVEGTTTLDTDLKAYASRDNGTTFSQIALADQGSLGYTGGIDSYSKLVLHCDGANAGTTFTDSSSEYPGNTAKTVTVNGSAQTSTAAYKFGTASLKTPEPAAIGNGLTIANADFDFSTYDAWTVEAWIRFDDVTDVAQGLWAANQDHCWGIFRNYTAQGGACTNKLGIWLSTNGSSWNLNEAPVDGTGIGTKSSWANDTWYHFATVFDGSTYKVYVDGTLDLTFTSSTKVAAPNSPLVGGVKLMEWGSGYGPTGGFMDEVRISPGIARYTANFTPQTLPWNVGRRLLSGSVDISGQPAGSNMKYKITTHNQAAAKQTRVYGTSMAWA